MKYIIEVTKATKRDLNKIPEDFLKRIDKKILSLANDPYPHDAKKIKGMDDLYRVRVGDYRILYLIENEKLVILIVRIRHRKDVYKK